MIKTARKRLKLTQKELATRLCMSQSFISKLENKRNIDGIALRDIANISKCLKLDEKALFDWIRTSPVYRYIPNESDFMDSDDFKVVEYVDGIDDFEYVNDIKVFKNNPDQTYLENNKHILQGSKGIGKTSFILRHLLNLNKDVSDDNI